MRAILRGCLLLSLILLVMAILGVGGTFYGTQVEPEFYQQALTTYDPEELESGSEELVTKTTALVSLANEEGHWKATFSEQEINGWLAVDLQKKHPHLLPPQIQDPRVVLTEDRVLVAWRWNHPQLSTVVSLDLQLFLAEKDVLAIRLCRASAGAIPLPKQTILDEVTAQAKKSQVQIQWKQEQGDPVALIHIPPIGEDDSLRRITGLKLSDKEVSIEGITEPQVSK